MNTTHLQVHALSRIQERKLVDYLDRRFLEITGAYRKRSQPSTSKLPTLASYLEANQQLLSIILQIPPIDPSTSLRITFLLRLTGDVMSSISGYPADLAALPDLLEFLDDLDQAWVTVLDSQIWNPSSKAAVDLVINTRNLTDSNSNMIHSTPMNQTERTRLRSLLVTGTAQLEEWLTGITNEEEEYQGALERAGLQQKFEDLFIRTLAEMGGLAGAINDPAGMEGTC
ncbi:hypothetical protein PILCRDRAFT_63850 [Piloderma croceum F 1598]|uniref:Uncharacterized protein n=1 Tax=Piloderma croceum (strain F 1598) TaxID=765440 RepID=A0A0C3G9N3_PILCF|nr:hypothetical protein PILCRDRAFT_63850 [Piloderma croceum F 1598]